MIFTIIKFQKGYLHQIFVFVSFCFSFIKWWSKMQLIYISRQSLFFILKNLKPYKTFFGYHIRQLSGLLLLSWPYHIINTMRPPISCRCRLAQSVTQFDLLCWNITCYILPPLVRAITCCLFKYLFCLTLSIKLAFRQMYDNSI